ncbi:hypothetical protein ACFPJ4_14260 [Lysinimonas soli]|uniref:Glycosyltransferase n=1 Tax=Lysinimonas soli TaxID=1074233 RepID=A0ABW0NVR3_9MICO
MAVIALSVVGATAAGDLAGYAATEYGVLLDLLRERGHRLVEPTGTDATHFVAMDHDRRSFSAIADRVPRHRRQLIVFEPRVVLPDNYWVSVRAQYGDVLSVGAESATPGMVIIPWPQHDWRAHPTPAGEHVAGTSVLVNSNKISMISGSLYGLRRDVIRAFDRDDLPLTLAGSNWSRRGARVQIENARALAYAIVKRERIDPGEWSSRLPLGGSVNNVGIVADKQAVLAEHEFAVVIENSANYVSEKLFDAVMAGCVPLYVGPPLQHMGIPDDVAIQLGRAPKPEAFTETVRTLGTAQKAGVLRAGAAWLADDQTYQTWAMPHALVRLANEIHQTIERGAEES